MYTHNILYNTRENKTRKEVVNYRCYCTATDSRSIIVAIRHSRIQRHKTGLCRTRPRLHVKPTTPPPNALPVVLLLLLLYRLIGVLV